MLKLSDYVVQHLAKFGLRHVFMITGGGAMHLNDSFGRDPRIEYICNHHEQAAAIAAEGYYRASGQLCVVNVTSGPGGTNTLTGVIGQWLDSIPCIYISGQVKQQTTISSCPELGLRQLGDQEINIIDIVKPVTKYAVMVRNPNEIRYHLDKALYLATHGRLGPVWLDIPLDVQAASIDETNLKLYDPREDELHFEMPTIRQQVHQLLVQIRKAERPVILAGHGIRLAGATDEFVDLVESLNVPVLTAICGHDLIWSDHPLFFGRPGICGDRIGNLAIQNSDLMIAIGARLGVRQIGYSYETFARCAYRVMVDIDPAELCKPSLHLDMPIHCDAKLFIKETLRQLSGTKLFSKSQWFEWHRTQKERLPTIIEENPSAPGYVNSYVFADTLFKALDPATIVITGNGTAYTGTFQVMRIKKGMRVFTNQGCATMGYDLPAAIGASVARDRQPIVLITGDGSIQMNLQELQTIVSYGLPIKIFVLSNNGYLAIRATQNSYFEGRHFGSEPGGGLTCPDMCRIAEAYGLHTDRISSEDDLVFKISQILASEGPCVCEVRMDPDQVLYPKISSVARPDGSMVSKPLEDMYPFLSREQYRQSMIIPPLDE